MDATDMMATLIVIICGILIALGKDGVVTSVLLTIVGFYFGKKVR